MLSTFLVHGKYCVSCFALKDKSKSIVSYSEQPFIINTHSIWLAILNGIQPDIASYFLLVIISTIGSAGTAPVPSASLVLIITAYNTVFNETGIPEGFSFILAIDWFMDRLRTVVNVTGDTVVCGMVSHLCPVEEHIAMEDNAAASKSSAASSVVGSSNDDEEAMDA